MTVELIRVAAGIILRGDSLLLVQQEMGGVGRWSLPGGVVEDGESDAYLSRDWSNVSYTSP